MDTLKADTCSSKHRNRFGTLKTDTGRRGALASTETDLDPPGKHSRHGALGWDPPGRHNGQGAFVSTETDLGPPRTDLVH